MIILVLKFLTSDATSTAAHQCLAEHRNQGKLYLSYSCREGGSEDVGAEGWSHFLANAKAKALAKQFFLDDLKIIDLPPLLPFPPSIHFFPPSFLPPCRV